MTDEEILAIAEKYGTSTTRRKPTYHLWDGSPTGETNPQTDWDFGQEDLLGFARELMGKNSTSTGLDQLIERIKFLEQQMRKN